MLRRLVCVCVAVGGYRLPSVISSNRTESAVPAFPSSRTVGWHNSHFGFLSQSSFALSFAAVLEQEIDVHFQLKPAAAVAIMSARPETTLND